MLVVAAELGRARAASEQQEQEWAECREKSAGNDTSMPPDTVCFYTADLMVEGCNVKVTEAVFVPHWPAGELVLRIAKMNTLKFTPLERVMVVSTSPGDESPERIEFEGDPFDEGSYYEMKVDLPDLSGGAKFVYKYEIVDGVTKNSVKCDDGLNHEDASHVVIWRGADWETGVKGGAELLVKVFPGTAVIHNDGNLGSVSRNGTTSTRPLGETSFKDVSYDSLKNAEVAVFFNKEECDAERECIALEREEKRRSLLFGKYTAGQFVGILFGVILALVVVYFILKCMCMGAPGGRRSNNYGYSGT